MVGAGEAHPDIPWGHHSWGMWSWMPRGGDSAWWGGEHGRTCSQGAHAGQTQTLRPGLRRQMPHSHPSSASTARVPGYNKVPTPALS